MKEFTFKDLFPFTLCQQGDRIVNKSKSIIRLTDCVLVWDNPIKDRTPFQCQIQTQNYEATGIYKDKSVNILVPI